MIGVVNVVVVRVVVRRSFLVIVMGGWSCCGNFDFDGLSGVGC